MIFIYPIVSFLMLFFAYKKQRKYGLCIPILYVLCFLCFFCPFLYLHPQFQLSNRAGTLTIEPIFYWFLCFVILLYPLYDFNISEYEFPQLKESKLLLLSKVFIIIAMVTGVAYLPYASNGLNMVNFEDSKLAYQSGEANFIKNYFLLKIAYLHSFLYPFISFFFFYCLAFLRDNKAIKALLGVAVFFPIVVITLAKCVRVDTAFITIQVFVLYFIFRNSLSKEIRKYTKMSFAIVGILVMLLMFMMSIFRFSSRNWDLDPMFYLYSYCAESLINFNVSLYDNINIYTYGDYSVPLIREMLGLQFSESDVEFKDRFLSLLSFNSWFFYTIIGEIYRDFGAIGGIMCCAILSVCSRFVFHRNKTGELSFLRLFYLFIYVDLIACGLFYNKYDSYGGNMLFVKIIISSFLIAFYFREVEDYKS